MVLIVVTQIDKIKGIIKVPKEGKNRCLILCKLGLQQIDQETQEEKNLLR